MRDPLFKAAFCQNCANAKCIETCAVGALTEDAEGIVHLDPEVCIGSGACVEACPFNAIWMDAKTGKAFKCDLCGGKPECVGYCLHDALKFE